MNYIKFIFWLICLISVMWIFYGDIRYRIVKHRFIFIISITSLISLYYSPSPFSQILVSTCVFTTFFLLWMMNVVGGGDVKLIGALFLGVHSEYMLLAMIAIGLLGGIQILLMWMMGIVRQSSPFKNGVPYTIPIGISGLFFFYISLAS
ncbi:prepilin peptidase [Vibrio harveyi]|uniref:A24 family peptidase n=1 Tax=Vibrio harveyi TaxID=669 RepID=UPI0006812EB6|nr:A24 family peptidase [Vibrio harveyi]EKO3783119.1 prepilin peptidase [Vibrio harveyi]EKO3834033.1 prepilin peptidase [Vibrio harveyi]EKY4196973.1 prepilin peptidase [Vibrio harveyi]ELH7812456.1 prepilin peptidase [Vibrio harveyi]